jgi:adenylylsulfate kinase
VSHRAGNQRALMLLQMDSIRKKMFPEPTYSDEERDAAYRSFALMGALVSSTGVAVLLDGVAHRRIWRELARAECPKFVEVYVKCPIEICMERESMRRASGDGIREKLYREALERLKTGQRIEGLGKVPGVDEPFEEPVSPEIVLDSSKKSPELLIEEAYQALSIYDPDLFYIGDRQ